MEYALKDSMDFNHIIDNDLKYFFMKVCSDYGNDIFGLTEEISKLKPKIQTQNYQNLFFKFMVMFICNFWIFQNVTLFLKRLLQSVFFENVYRIVNVKIHLHHLHVTGKLYGYADDF